MGVRTQPCPCPRCDTVLDAAMRVTPDGQAEIIGPEPGDVTVCWYCTATLRFTEDMRLEEFDPPDGDPEYDDLRMWRDKLRRAGHRMRDRH